jgi:surface antigen
VLSTLASAQQSAVIALPAADKEIADATRLKALESALSKSVVAWKGASPGTSGSVTPMRTYLARNGMMCREFEETMQVPDTGVVLNRLACRDAQGIWHLVR